MEEVKNTEVEQEISSSPYSYLFIMLSALSGFIFGWPFALCIVSSYFGYKFGNIKIWLFFMFMLDSLMFGTDTSIRTLLVTSLYAIIYFGGNLYLENKQVFSDSDKYINSLLEKHQDHVAAKSFKFVIEQHDSLVDKVKASGVCSKINEILNTVDSFMVQHNVTLYLQKMNLYIDNFCCLLSEKILALPYVGDYIKSQQVQVQKQEIQDPQDPDMFTTTPEELTEFKKQFNMPPATPEEVERFNVISKMIAPALENVSQEINKKKYSKKNKKND